MFYMLVNLQMEYLNYYKMESKDKQFIMNMVMQGQFLAKEDIPQPKKKISTVKKSSMKNTGSNKALMS